MLVSDHVRMLANGRAGDSPNCQNLQQMRAFYLIWPLDDICQTLSGKSSPAQTFETPSAKSSPPQILQTLSGESQGAQSIQPTSAPSPDLATLAQAFPLPWSAYVRLLSVKNDQARRFCSSR